MLYCLLPSEDSQWAVISEQSFAAYAVLVASSFDKQCSNVPDPVLHLVYALRTASFQSWQDIQTPRLLSPSVIHHMEDIELENVQMIVNVSNSTCLIGLRGLQYGMLGVWCYLNYVI